MNFLASIAAKVLQWILASTVGALITYFKERADRLRKEKDFKENLDKVQQKIDSAKTKQEAIDAARENARISSSSD